MRIAASITTYNRPNECFDVFNDFCEQIEALGYEATIFIYDDASTEENAEHFLELLTAAKAHLWNITFEYNRGDVNHGKKGHWKVANEVFDWFRREEWDYAFYLQDDLSLKPRFIQESIELFELIKHEKKCCLNYLIEESRKDVPVWTKVPPLYKSINGKSFYQVGWTDLHFMANREFFRALDYEIEPIDPERWDDGKHHLSSGVGRQISIRLFIKSMGMFQVRKSLAIHRMIPSVMNPKAYKKNPDRLKSI